MSRRFQSWRRGFVDSLVLRRIKVKGKEVHTPGIALLGCSVDAGTQGGNSTSRMAGTPHLNFLVYAGTNYTAC